MNHENPIPPTASDQIADTETSHQERPWFNEIAYRQKLKFLKDLSRAEYFDQPLASILERFYKLPLNTTGSCSWYTKADCPDELDACCPAHLLITEDQRVNEETRRVQESFRSQLPELETAINQRLGAEAVKLQAQRFIGRKDDGMSEYTSVVDEYSENPLSYDLMFLVRDKQVAQTRGREALTAIWQEFYRYLERFDGEHLPLPDFHNGDDFIRKSADAVKKAA